MDGASATETADSGLIPWIIKPMTVKLLFTAPLLDVQQLNEECETPTSYGEKVGRLQLESKTARSLRCLLSKANG